MATSTLISVEDYVSGAVEVPEDWYCDYEYVDGEIEERFLGEITHAQWQAMLFLWFQRHADEWNIHVLNDVRVQVSPTRFRVPDVVVWSRDAAEDRFLRNAPLAAFEVLSPEDRISRALVKLDDYARMGIGTIRVIDPARDKIFRYVDGGLDPVTEIVEPMPGSQCHMDWAEIRQMLTRKA